MTTAKERMVIGEKIHCMYKIIVVALPDNNDDYIVPCSFPQTVFSGTIYYDDNTAESFNDYHMTLEAMEKARECMPRHTRDWKLTIVYGANSLGGRKDNEAAHKANEKLINKLSEMTRWDFHNKRY